MYISRFSPQSLRAFPSKSNSVIELTADGSHDVSVDFLHIHTFIHYDVMYDSVIITLHTGTDCILLQLMYIRGHLGCLYCMMGEKRLQSP